MNLIFLGTGTSQGVPVIGCRCPVCTSGDIRDKRLRSSILIETGRLRIVVDCGPDFRQQMLREDVRAIDAILITHEHKDHIGGLDDVRAFNYILKRPMDVYASAPVIKTIRKEYAYSFGDKPYPGVPEINLKRFGNNLFSVEDLTVIPVRAEHYQHITVYGFRIGDLTYITDAVSIPEQELRKIYGSRILVINALRKKKHYSHFCLSDALDLIRELKPEKAYLTHISHQMGLHRDVEGELPDHVKLASDGMRISSC